MSATTQPRIANAPDYRIRIGGDVITPRIRPRLVDLTITEHRGNTADELSLTLEDSDGRMALPDTGVTIDVAIGWQRGGVTPRGEFTVDEIEASGAPDQIHIRGRSANLRTTLPDKRTRSWDNITLGDIIDAIAGRHDLTPAIAARLAAKQIPHIDQTDESDLNFLTRLGQRYDAVATVKAGRLLFTPAGQAQSVSGRDLAPVALTRADGDRHSYRKTDRDTYTGVIAYWRDNSQARRQRVTAGNADDKAKTLRDTYPTQPEAQDAAAAEWRRLQRGERSLKLTLARGRADIGPETPITVIGYKAAINAVAWIVTQATHQINGQGYTTRVECEARPG